MTLVVAVKNRNKEVFMGADTLVTAGSIKKHYDDKIIQYKHFNIGTAGLMVIAQELKIGEISKELNKINPKTIQDVKKIYDLIVPMAKKLIEHTKEEDDDGIHNELMVCTKDKIWKLHPHGYIEEVDDYCVIGSGTSYATGYLDGLVERDIELDDDVIFELIFDCGERLLSVGGSANIVSFL